MTLDKEKIRTQISKILIKHSMPTRQIAISDIIALLSERLEGKIEEIRMLRHEIQQSKVPLGNEQWKEGHTKCLKEVLEILSASKE